MRLRLFVGDAIQSLPIRSQITFVQIRWGDTPVTRRLPGRSSPSNQSEENPAKNWLLIKEHAENYACLLANYTVFVKIHLIVPTDFQIKLSEVVTLPRDDDLPQLQPSSR